MGKYNVRNFERLFAVVVRALKEGKLVCIVNNEGYHRNLEFVMDRLREIFKKRIYEKGRNRISLDCPVEDRLADTEYLIDVGAYT